MSSVSNPLVGSPPAEVPLQSAPLVRVLAQVQFPLIASIRKEDFIASFQEVLRPEYPVLRREEGRGVMFAPEGIVRTDPLIIWRFFDATEAWRVSLAPTFIAIETTRYKSRSDLLARFRFVLKALAEQIRPAKADRLGLRYIDRITGQEIQDVQTLVEPQMLGILATPLEGHTIQSLTQAVFESPKELAQILARWGRVPPNSTVDPAAIEPVPETSWILDLDIFSAEPRPFEVETLISLTQRFSERLYSFFRWVVTDKFLQRYGGQP